jgi:hypothetical protein
MRWLVSRGWHGWALLAILVIAFDVAAAALGGEPMTNSVRRWLRHAPAAWVAVPLLVFLLAHMTVMPARYDPLERTYTWLYKRTHQPHRTTPVEPPPATDGHPGNG